MRLTTIPYRHGSRSQVEPIAAKYIGILSQQPGYHSGTFAFDDADDEFVAVSLWGSRGQAQAATANVRDPAQLELAELMRGAPSTRILDVFESGG